MDGAKKSQGVPDRDQGASVLTEMYKWWIDEMEIKKTQKRRISDKKGASN